MRYLKYAFYVVSFFLLGYAHVVALDEFALEEDRIAALQKSRRSAPQLEIAKTPTASWFEITPEKELVENVLYAAKVQGERKFALLRYGQYAGPCSAEDFGKLEILSFEAGIKLWRAKESAIGFAEFPELE